MTNDECSRIAQSACHRQALSPGATPHESGSQAPRVGSGLVNRRLIAGRALVCLYVLAIVLSSCVPGRAAPTVTPTAAPPTVTAGATTPAVAASPRATVIAQPVTLTPPSTPVIAGSLAALLPSIVAEVDLGVRFERPLVHAIALDVASDRIFVGASPDKTLILSAADFRMTDTLAFGGDVALDRSRRRLFIGAPGGVVVLDLDTLQSTGAIPIAAGPFGSTPVVDESTGKILVVSRGVYVASLQRCK